MDLSGRLARAAIRRAAVLLVEVPGWAATRYAAERAIRNRGWRLALSPAEADVLLVCGAPGPRMTEAVELVWAQLPGPRARAAVTARSAVDAALDGAAAEVLDAGRQRADAEQRSSEPDMGTPAGGPEDGTSESDGDMDHGDMDHGDMDHGDMEMAPGGIPLAGGAEDRDGLEMDVLHVPLGPVLPCWPAGLLLHCTLSGDVVTEARVEVLEPAEDAVPDPPAPRAPVVDRLDRAARLLTLAGGEKDATDLLRLRDDVLAGVEDAAVAARLDRLAHRLRRSRLLRWSLRGAAPIGPGTCADLGLDDRAAGDVHDRLLALLAEAREVLDGGRPPAPVRPDVLARLLPGLELGAARLLVAGLDLDTTAVAAPATAAGP